jgi:hypothetical protein
MLFMWVGRVGEMWSWRYRCEQWMPYSTTGSSTCSSFSGEQWWRSHIYRCGCMIFGCVVVIYAILYCWVVNAGEAYAAPLAQLCNALSMHVRPRSRTVACNVEHLSPCSHVCTHCNAEHTTPLSYTYARARVHTAPFWRTTSAS